MSDELEEKYVRFVSKLIELTQAGMLKWKARNENEYFAVLNGRTLDVYRTDETSVQSNLASVIVGAGRRRIYALNIGKTEDADMFSIKNQYGVQNLFTSVVLASTKVESFMDSVLSDKR